MPRKSAASLAVVPLKGAGRIRPRPGTPKEVATVFNELVGTVAADHFRACDVPLIEQYAEAVVLGREAYSHLSSEGQVIAGRPSPWIVCLEKAHRAMAALSMRLRLAPQARMRAETASRGSHRQPNYYDLHPVGDDNGG